MSCRLLSPPTLVSKLDGLAMSCVTTKGKFKTMLNIPYIDLIKINDTQTLYPVINEAFLSFIQLQSRDTNQVRKILNYALTMVSLLPTIPGSMPVASFVNIFSQIVSKYVEEASSSLEETHAFLTTFSDTIATVKQAMVAINKTVLDLADHIEKNLDQLKQENIIVTLFNIFDKFYELSDGENSVADILHVSVSDLDISFGSAPEPLIQDLVRKLRDLKDVHNDIHSKASGLLMALKETFDLSYDMTGVWSLIRRDYDILRKDPALFPTDNIPLLTTQWSQVRVSADNYVMYAALSSMTFFK